MFFKVFSCSFCGLLKDYLHVIVMEAEICYHIPALLSETMTGLDIKPDGIYVDVTFGGGGHSKEILCHLGETGRLFGFDQDMDAFANCPDDSRFTFVHSNFRYLKNFLRYHGVTQVDGILADLGVSFHHFDDEQRGFSFRFLESALDMRMSRESDVDARAVVNTYSEEALARILRLYGDLRNANRIASTIVKARSSRSIETTGDLMSVVKPLINPRQEKKELSQIFQAFRMEVNHEVDALTEFLSQTLEVLKPGGRLAIITYHSIEDRMVKNFQKSGNIDGNVEKDFFGRTTALIRPCGKPIVPTDEEVARNPRSRSAKLRVAERLSE